MATGEGSGVELNHHLDKVVLHPMNDCACTIHFPYCVAMILTELP
jgi:hypothetical protein